MRKRLKSSSMKCIEVNPNMPAAHLFAATQFIESEQYEKAMESINKALAVNPQDGGSFQPRGIDPITCKAILPTSISYKEKVLAANPQYSKLYYTLADSCGVRPSL